MIARSILPAATEKTLDWTKYGNNLDVSTWFLELPGRHEYHNGEVLEMETGTQNYNRIARNVMNVCEDKLEGTRCLVHGIEVPVEIASDNRYVMPDAVIHCDEADRGSSIINHPTAVFEVLSPGTEAYDRGEKWELYQKIPSLQDYLLLSQDRKHVDHYQWRDGLWVYFSISTESDSIILSCINQRIQIARFYEGAISTEVEAN